MALLRSKRNQHYCILEISNILVLGFRLDTDRILAAKLSSVGQTFSGSICSFCGDSGCRSFNKHVEVKPELVLTHWLWFLLGFTISLIEEKWNPTCNYLAWAQRFLMNPDRLWFNLCKHTTDLLHHYDLVQWRSCYVISGPHEQVHLL